MSREVKLPEGQPPEKDGRMTTVLTWIGALGLLLLHFGMAVLGLMMGIAALAVPVLLVMALLRWLFGAGQ